MSAIESTKPGAFISLSAAADMLGISVHTLRRRIASGDLPAYRALHTWGGGWSSPPATRSMRSR